MGAELTPPGDNPHPRYGTHWKPGEGARAIYFVKAGNYPDGFVAMDPLTGEALVVEDDERIQMTNLQAGQTLFVNRRGQEDPIATKTAQGWDDEKENNMKHDSGKKVSPLASAGIILFVLSGLAGIVVGTIAGINWAISL